MLLEQMLGMSDHMRFKRVMCVLRPALFALRSCQRDAVFYEDRETKFTFFASVSELIDVVIYTEYGKCVQEVTPPR